MSHNREAGPDDETGADQMNLEAQTEFVPEDTPRIRPVACPDCGTIDLVHLVSCPVGRSLDDAAAEDRARFAYMPVREIYRPLTWGEREHLPLTPEMRGIQPGDIGVRTMMRVTYMAPGLRVRGIGNRPLFIDADAEVDGALDAAEAFLQFIGGLPEGTLSTYDTRHRVATYHLHSTEVTG